MATNPPLIGENKGVRIVKASGFRVSDVARSTTTDYAEVIAGDGVPSGGYGRAAGTTLVYLRKDATSADAAAYVTFNGGTTWFALQTSGAGGSQSDLIFDAATEL